MRLLLDTNALIYWITDKELLSDDLMESKR